ncbi:adhesion G protein-coupled receptor L3-like isoform X2 [Halichondria panicea]|uniref:adhesion G protein-coupled receptor L3-like isoform X2 n=1 Tax=Halichondria panicea TaxID=6063 RepID=UPI00312B72DC
MMAPVTQRVIAMLLCTLSQCSAAGTVSFSSGSASQTVMEGGSLSVCVMAILDSGDSVEMGLSVTPARGLDVSTNTLHLTDTTTTDCWMVTATDDAIYEADSQIFTLNLALVNPTSSDIVLTDPSTATITVMDNEGAVVSLVNPTIVQNEGDGDVSVCARLDSPAGGAEREIFIALNNNDFTFPSNSRVGATQCLTIPVTNDNVYQTSPVLMETVTLSKSLVVTNQGRLDLTNTVAMVTINDNDDAVVSMDTPTITTTEGGVVGVCANLVSPSGGTSVPITVVFTWNNGGSNSATFSANSNANTLTCIQLTVADDDIYGMSPIPVYTVVLSISSPNSRVSIGGIGETTITVSDDDDAVVSMVTPPMTTTEGAVVEVCANLVSPFGGTSVPITVVFTWSGGSDSATFSANSNPNTQACIQLTVADDDIYGTSPIPVYTVVLSSFNSRVTVGRNSQTTITVRDDDDISEATINIINDDGVVCEAERDSVWGLVFPATVAGFSYSQQCPQNGNGTTLGTVTRFCTLGGVWEAVNIDNCTREVISSLNDRANELFSRNASQKNASQNEVDNLLVSLAKATSVNATGDSTIFPKDLSTTNTIVKSSVNYLVQNIETASPMSSLNFSEEVMNVLNNVLEERNTEGWERLQVDSAAESQQLLLSAELYGQYVSLALRSEAVDTGNMTEITLVRQNIVLAAIEVDTTSLDNIIFPEVVEVSEETGSAQTVIPAALLMERGALDGNVTAVNILFSNLEDFLPKTNLEMNTTRPVSQVISSQVFSNVKLTNSQAQATFRFTTQKFPADEVAENARCVFWSVSSDAANSTWSTEGVITVSVDEDEQMRVYNIVCESSHFTAFAVLVDVTGALNDTTPEISFALSVVTYVGCSISIFFLLLSIFYFLTLRKELLTKVHNFIHLNLSISLLLGYVVFLSGVETAVANKGACVFVAALLHYLFTTVCFWMLCEGIMLYLKLVLVFNRISKKWWIFFIIGWVVPVIPVAISAGLIHDQYGTEEYCWIAVGAGDKGAIWAFVVPMLLVVLVNIFFLLAALRSVYNLRKSTMQRSEKKESLKLFSQLFKATVILLPLLGLTWVFGLLSVNSSTIVFAWLFSIFNSLQGLFVFIFHVLRSEKVTNFLKQCRKRMDSVVSTASGKNNPSKNLMSGVQLKPIHSRFSKHNYSMMTDEAIETAASEFGSEKLYIAGSLESDN